MIKIMTRLDSGIYASQGGGEIKEKYCWNKTSGRNLLLATKKLMEHRTEMIKSFGNIGCGNSWIEIDGKKVNRDVEINLESIANNNLYSGTPTQAMNEVLKDGF
jgi:hypothetical protein